MTFDRDWTIAPGETLREWIEENGLSPRITATVARLRPVEIEGVLRGSRKITPRIAAGLQRATDIPARLWLNLERAYRADLAAGRTDTTVKAASDEDGQR
jgi:HTH-type transcriptional regulator/antitoxin HigA